MKKFILVPWLGFLLSCATTQKLETMKPEPNAAEFINYMAETSFIHLPITLTLKEIEKQINKQLTGLIYHDSILNDDDVKMKVWKKAPIQMSYENGKLLTILPLKVDATYQYGFDRMGIQLKDSREFKLNGTVSLLSEIGLTNWQIKTKTVIKNLNWDESPTMNIAGKNMPITYLINPAIRLFKNKIEKNIDEAILNTMDFKPQVMEALDKISEPFLMSETYESWLRLVPIEVYTTEAQINSKEVKVEMGLKCMMETHIGNQPSKKFDSKKIVLKPVTKMPDKISANIVAVSTYKEASRIMTNNFQDEEFGEGKKKVKVNKVDLWHKDQKMIIALQLSGSVNGSIYLSGFPQFNHESQEIYFDKLDYVLDTKSVLMRTANWMAQGYVLKKLREMCRYSIQPNMEEGKALIESYMNNYSPMKGVFINGTIQNFEFVKIQLTEQAILAYLKGTGALSIRVDGME
jgi:hypothetical protein